MIHFTLVVRDHLGPALTRIKEAMKKLATITSSKKKKATSHIRWMKRSHYQTFEVRKYNSQKGLCRPWLHQYYEAKAVCLVKRLNMYRLPKQLKLLYDPEMKMHVLSLPASYSLSNKVRRNRILARRCKCPEHITVNVGFELS